MPSLPAVRSRILIVDDDERQRSALVAMLPDGDFESQVAVTGQDALELLGAAENGAISGGIRRCHGSQGVETANP
jgi:CheY-like chemotaxis protein